MRVVVVEDERPARERLVSIIRAVDGDVTVDTELTGVAETVEWLERNGCPDLLFLDIQLTDGSSFEILRRTPVTCPVVFVTAYDEHVLEALDANAIDYLLKPARPAAVASAIEKYRRLEQHFTSRPSAALEALVHPRTRLLVRKGIDFLSIRTTDVAYIYSADKITFAVTSAGVRHMLDRPLSVLEPELDPERFFRVNRAWLVSHDAIARCRPYGKGRLLLELQPPAGAEVVVSQERAASFRQWLGG